LSEGSLRRLVCLLKRYRQLVLCQHLTPRAARGTLGMAWGGAANPSTPQPDPESP
jgi:hypothetical protein